MNLQTGQTQYEAPKTETAWSRVKKALGPLTVGGGMRGNWGADARQLRRIDLQCPGRSVRCASFHRSRLVRIFSQSFQPYASRYAGRRTNRDCVVALALVAGIRPAPLVRVEVSKFYYLVDGTFVAAADLFVIPQTNRRRTALFRSQ